MAKSIAKKIIFVFLLVFVAILLTPKTNAITTTTFSADTISITRKSTLTYNTYIGNYTFNNTFTYTISPYVDADNGISNPTGAANEPTSAQIVYNEYPSYDAQTETLYVSKTATVDFSDTTYTQPGQYIYEITETASQNSSLYPLSNQAYYIVVDVVYQTYDNVPNNSELVATVEQAAFSHRDDATGQLSNKSNVVWEGDIQYGIVAVTAGTFGNLASTSRCFDYTITIQQGASVPANGNYYMTAGYHDSVSDDIVASECEPPDPGDDTRAFSLTPGVPTSFKLKHDDVMLAILPAGTSYTITAVDDLDYDETVDGNASPLTVDKVSTGISLDDIQDAAEEGPSTEKIGNITFITRTKNAVPFLGILTSIWFYIALLAIVSGGIAVAIARSKRDRIELYVKKR